MLASVRVSLNDQVIATNLLLFLRSAQIRFLTCFLLGFGQINSLASMWAAICAAAWIRIGLTCLCWNVRACIWSNNVQPVAQQAMLCVLPDLWHHLLPTAVTCRESFKETFLDSAPRLIPGNAATFSLLQKILLSLFPWNNPYDGKSKSDRVLV